MYYSSNELFSRQSPFNFIMGERGNGKSFEAKRRIINNMLKKQEQAIYIRRRQTDVDNVKDNFFDDMIEFFPDVEFLIRGNIGYINGEVAIHFIALSTSYKIKSKPFPHVTLLVFDEYIEPSTKFPNYFKDDMFKLFELVNTVVRKRNNWKLLLIGNAISYVNPFFTFFNIEIKDNKKRFHSYKLDKDYGTYLITVELTDTPIFKEEYSKSLMAKIISGTSYGNYAMDATVYEDNNDFILERKAGQYFYVCTILNNNKEVGIWLHEQGHYYVDDILDSTTQYKFALMDEDLKEGYSHIKNNMKSWRVKKLKESYLNGEVFYKNQECKKFFIGTVAKFI